MIAKVADASVIAALVFGEPRAEEAMRLLRGSSLYEPVLLSFELMSVARRKILRHPDQAETIKRAFSMALALDIHWVETDFEAALRLALDTGLTTYDATYLSLARQIKVPLVTFDEQLAGFIDKLTK